jgi:hypothetical protein
LVSKFNIAPGWLPSATTMLTLYTIIPFILG